MSSSTLGRLPGLYGSSTAAWRVVDGGREEGAVPKCFAAVGDVAGSSWRSQTDGLASSSSGAAQIAECDSATLRGNGGRASTSVQGFATSELIQGKIREACDVLQKKFDLLAVRAQALEESVEAIKEELKICKAEIQVLKGNEQGLQNNLELLENSVPEAVEGSDHKSYIVELINSAVSLDESEEMIASNIRRIHRDPFRKKSNSSRP
ncbi:hypothetical protein NDU88_000845 [Pleurodeles waltl]|uniref:Uncharacterized protein n=1 Tax=Pleurodeles waltl TaxID=8319 RepID=A0AAV7LBD6_PLEWA|nr:hypothetical protein NDU88_000845 [Pleurodeles waltl]